MRIYLAVSFLFPSQIVPLTPAQASDIIFDDRQAQQLLTPTSMTRPHASKPTRSSPPTGMHPPPSSPSSRNPLRPPLHPVSHSRPRVLKTFVSYPTKKGKERATGNDENVPAGTNTTKALGDYSIYKGRGRYGPQAQYVPLCFTPCVIIWTERKLTCECVRPLQGGQGDDQCIIRDRPGAE